MKTIAQEKHNIDLLKLKAPSVYAMYRTRRIAIIKQELEDMRTKYKDLSEEEKTRVKNHAIYLKTILTELGIGGAETHQSKDVGNTAHDQTEAIHS